MAEEIVVLADMKKGDKISFSLDFGDTFTGKAATMIPDIKGFRGGEVLATLVVTENASNAGEYFFASDADTTDWPSRVKFDIWFTDIEIHSATTFQINFGEGVTDGRNRS